MQKHRHIFTATPALRTIALRQLLFFISLVLGLSACSDSALPPSHTVKLGEEFSAARAVSVDSFPAYLQLEDRLFAQLDKRVYSRVETGPSFSLARFSKGSLADPTSRDPNWNRSFELAGGPHRGAVLLLHGMSDSPYSLRALGETLHGQGFHVLGLRLPGHGTAPSGMTDISWQDMAAAVTLAMRHLADRVGERPVHIIGYSTGAPLALDFALRAEQGSIGPAPASMVLISPAIGISPAAALASWKRRLSLLPGLGRLAWLQIEPEFDPYKYNSFATNAAEQVHSLTSSVAARIADRNGSGKLLPPILVLKSTVDATVSNNAVVDRLLMKLAPGRHELVLFDINRYAANASLLVDDPGAFTTRMLEAEQLPFGLTLVANTDSSKRAVSLYYKPALAAAPARREQLGQQWPSGIFSLSHVALPFPPDDPLYGSGPPRNPEHIFLGTQALQGERDVLKISGDYLLRLRYNPFYSYLEQRVLEWITP